MGGGAATGLFACLALGAVSPSGVQAQWVEAPGQGWLQVSLYHHNTAEEFGFDRQQRSIRNGGHAIASSVYVTAAAGLFPGVDAWLQLPAHRIEYNDFAADRVRSGVGDLRIFVRTQPLSFLGSAFPFAVRAGVKLPTGEFPLDAEIIPLGEGQRDWEVIAEMGHSFYPRALYAMAWAGYRWREADTERVRDFGDEAFFLAAVGGTWRRATVKLTAEGWDSHAPLLEGIRLENASREMLQITPSLGTQVGPGMIEAGLRVPLSGRNLPAGPAFTVRYFLGFGG